jgi:hypothetical protein
VIPLLPATSRISGRVLSYWATTAHPVHSQARDQEKYVLLVKTNTKESEPSMSSFSELESASSLSWFKVVKCWRVAAVDAGGPPEERKDEIGAHSSEKRIHRIHMTRR